MFKVGQKVYTIRHNRVIPFRINKVIISEFGICYESQDLEPCFSPEIRYVFKTKKEAYLKILDNLYREYKETTDYVREYAKRDKVKLN